VAKTALRELARQLEVLNDELSALHVTIGDRPPDEAALVDQLEDAVLNLMALTPKALINAREAGDAIGTPVDPAQLRRSLTACQVSFQRVDNSFEAVYLRHRLNELVRFAGTHGGDWVPWANTTIEAIERCREDVSRVRNALTVCWQEAAEFDRMR